MRILVTGNLGYVGSVTAPYLKRLGHDVRGLDAGYFRECLFDAADDVPTAAGDVREVEARQLAGFDAVVHLAALSNDPMGDLNPALTDEINHRAAVRLAAAAREAGVGRFVFASSCSMYGAGGGDEALDERAAFNPQSAYAQSKVDAEAGISALATEDFAPTFLRFATAYGVSPRLRLDLVVNNLSGWAHTTGRVKIMSDGSPWRPLIHVRDMARAVAAVIDAPRAAVHNEAFNAGRDEDNYQVRDIAARVEKIIPDCSVEYAGAGTSADTRTYKVSFAKISRCLPGFAPRESLEKGIDDLHRAFCRAPLAEADLEGKDYTRLKQLKHLIAGGNVDQTLRPLAAAVTADGH